MPTQRGDRWRSTFVRARAAGDGCSTACARASRSARCSAIASSAGCSEQKLAQFIEHFREVAPLVADKLPGTEQPGDRPVEAIAANNVVDGLALQRKWRATSSAPTLFADAAECSPIDADSIKSTRAGASS